MMLAAHRLALALGEWDVPGLLARMPARVFWSWLAYYQIEPWGEQRGDLRMGVLASLVYNLTRRRSARARTPGDFVLRFGARPVQSQASMAAILSAAADAARAVAARRRRS